MKIAFFGTPDFAVETLDRIYKSGYDIALVVTAPDKPSGRGQSIAISDVKRYALENNLPVLQPEKLRDEEFVSFFQNLNLDLAIVVAFRMIPEIIWSIPKLGTINLHGSLLPNYRGAAPINWALINGEEETGLTTFFINNQIDTGNVLMQEKCAIGSQDNFGSLYDKMKKIGADLVLKTIEKLFNGELKEQPQILNAQCKLAPKITKDIFEIKDFSSCYKVHNLLRGLLPIYKPFFMYNNKKYIIKLGIPVITNHHLDTGGIDTDNKTYLRLMTDDGYYEIHEIQPEGKASMDIKSFFNGNSL